MPMYPGTTSAPSGCSELPALKERQPLPRRNLARFSTTEFARLKRSDDVMPQISVKVRNTSLKDTSSLRTKQATSATPQTDSSSPVINQPRGGHPAVPERVM